MMIWLSLHMTVSFMLPYKENIRTQHTQTSLRFIRAKIGWTANKRGDIFIIRNTNRNKQRNKRNISQKNLGTNVLAGYAGCQ